MTQVKESNNIEERILETAKILFIEKGFTETSMSEIAAAIGINRPVLHYYYRTKEKLFKAVSGMIIQSILPKVQNIIQNKHEPISVRIRNIVETYYSTLSEYPNLPLFIYREMHRDTGFLIESIMTSEIKDSFNSWINNLQEEMEEDLLEKIPLRILFLSFYSLLTFPFLTKDFCSCTLLKDGESFDKLLEEWKPYLVSQITFLLCPKNNK